MTYNELKKIVTQYGFTIEELNFSYSDADIYIYAPESNYYHNSANVDSYMNRVWATASVSNNKNNSINSLHLYLKLRKVRNGGMYFDGCDEKVVYEEDLSEKFIKNTCISVIKNIKKKQSNFKMNKIKDMF